MIIDVINPKWIGEEPAWDITINGDVFEKDVTKSMIFSQMRVAHSKKLISDFDFMYKECFPVRQWEIEAYVKSKIN